MRTSRLPARRLPPALLRRALEALGLAVAFALVPELIRARTGAALEPHPGWIAVVVLAARDGSAGLFAGLLACAGAVGIAAALAGAGPAAAWGRLDSGPDLLAFGACLTVSWVASWHLRRQAELGERIRALSDRVAGADETVEALRGVIVTLRARVDRTATSLSFLREVAGRLEGRDPVAAAEGAADLVLARTGACAAAVELGRNGTRRLLAVRDARGPRPHAPLALRDADLSVPIRDGNERLGSIALWGIPSSGLDDATAHDLVVIAAWCVPALAVAAWQPEEPAGAAGWVL